ncbi:MAG: PKD domain-containing protein [Methanolinea sp.]|nr:MAG: PKD domain-containing protein [Methanolinea sp.]
MVPDEIEPHHISLDSARVLADAALLEFVLAGSPGALSGSWEGSHIAPGPITIYDINGEPLFFHFDVMRDGAIIGGVKIGASRILPSSVMAVELTPRYWDVNESGEVAEASLLHMCPQCSITSSEPVCYSYPKIGQRITFVQWGSEVEEEFIFDPTTSTQVPEDWSWSYYNSLDDATGPPNSVAWDEEEAIHRLVLEKARIYGYPGTSLNQEKMQALRKATFPEYQVGSSGAGVLGAGEAPSTGKKVLPITLYPQKKGDWCAVASIQMISDYFGTYFDQDDIARLTNTKGGMYVEDQVEFLILHLGKQETYADYSPSFQKEVYEIENNRPFGSNVESFTIAGGHARVGAGYNDDWGRNEIYIYDPWPMNQGSVYWEPYSSVNHICDVFIRGSDTPRIEPPVTRFSYTFDKTTVTFIDLSTENPDSWYWTFGDGTISTSQNPTHTYAQPGSYWVTLTASNSGGSSRSILAVYIPGDTPSPTATPITTPTVSIKPTIFLKVYPTVVPTTVPTVPVATHPTIFPKVIPTVVPTTVPTVPVATHPTIFPKVYPTVVPTTVPTVPVATHPTIFPKVYPTVVPTTVPTVPVATYPTIFPKVYPTVVPTTVPTVPVATYPTIFPKVYPTSSPTTLPTGSPSRYISSFIPVANFNHMSKGTSVIFVDTSVGPTGWLWDFGDGTSSTESDPIHTYKEPGTFTVSLKVTNSAGSSTISKTLTVGSFAVG